MPRNDEGEFELMLGNKQLLSVFFIVVVLMGVFFTMGYIVGRNSSTDAAAQLAAVPGQPLVVESETEPASSPATTATAVRAPEPAPAAAQSPVAAKPPEVARIPPEPRPATKPPAPKPAPVRVAGVAEPASGQVFLQVAATGRNEANLLLEVLGKRGFSGQLAPVPGQDLFRVLVGPVAGSEELSEIRSGLQAAGFKPFTRKY